MPDRELVWVQPTGELDLDTVGALRTQVGELLAAGFDRLVIDLRALSFIDVSGVRLLLTLNEQAGRDDWSLFLVHGAGQVQRLLALSGALEQLPRRLPAAATR